MSDKQLNPTNEEIFLGRVEEQSRFRDALEDLLREPSLIDRVRKHISRVLISLLFVLFRGKLFQIIASYCGPTVPH
jgi:hypothetical protein